MPLVAVANPTESKLLGCWLVRVITGKEAFLLLLLLTAYINTAVLLAVLS